MDLKDEQEQVEVYLWYLTLELCWEFGTVMFLMIEAWGLCITLHALDARRTPGSMIQDLLPYLDAWVPGDAFL